MNLPIKIPSPTTRNHDGHRTNPPTTTAEYNTTTSDKQRHITTNWSTIASKPHPNKQHINYSEGRGPSSSKRYRRRTTAKRRTQTPTTPSYYLQQMNAFRPRTNNTLRKIHNKHRNILLIPPTTSEHTNNADADADLDLQIENLINEFNELSDNFDSTYQRLAHDNEYDYDDEIPQSPLAQFNLELLLETEAIFLEADTILSNATTSFHQYANTIGHITDPTSSLNPTPPATYRLEPTIIPPHYQIDDDASDTDEEPDLSDLSNLYQQTNPPPTPTAPNPPYTPTLIELLAHYLPTQTSTTIVSNNQEPPDISHTPDHSTKPAPPTLPPPIPHPDSTTNPTHATLNLHLLKAANLTLPPILPPPIKPLDKPPNWTPTNNANAHHEDSTQPLTTEYDDEQYFYQQPNPFQLNEYTTTDNHHDLHLQYNLTPWTQHPDDLTLWTQYPESETTYEPDHNEHQQTGDENHHMHQNPADEQTYNTDGNKSHYRQQQLQKRMRTNHHKHPRAFTNLLTCVTQNARGLPENDDTKLQSIINQMKANNWAATCIQETWRLRQDEFYIDGYHVILQGHTTKSNNKGHVMAGVCIILSPTMDAAHELAGNKRISFPIEHKHEGRFLGVHLHFKKRDSHGKKVKGMIKLALCSIYHPTDSNEHDEFNGMTQTLLSNLPDDTSLLFGHNINCNVGTSLSNDDHLRRTVGPHGLNNRNSKGTRFLQHLCSLQMRVANSYFIKPNYATWKNFNSNRPSSHMLDVFSISNNMFKHVSDCGLIHQGIDHTDHTATAITININCIAFKSTKRDNTLTGGRTDWTRILYDEEANREFNCKLSRETTANTETEPTYTEYFTSVPKAAKSTAIAPEIEKNAWFEMSKQKLQPIIDRVTSLRAASRDPTNADLQKTKLEQALAHKLRNIAVREAKSIYMSHIAEKISTLTGENTRTMWEAVKDCKLGHEINYLRPQNMSLTLADGARATNDKENMSVMQAHCQKLFNNRKEVSPDALDHITQREVEPSLDDPITWKEFTRAINGLKNNKSPGENEIPAEAFKAMNNDHRNRVFSFINSFWNNTSDFPEWHTGRGVPVQKVPHPTTPNQYRIVNLMDVGSKIFSRILTARLYTLLEKHGTKYQFGATPHSGCQDGNFTLKTLLHLRRQHNLETFVVFADLVKAFDTSDHLLIASILEKYGAPPKFSHAIERLYTDLRVTLKIGKESTEIEQTVGVRQGDNLSPVIFLFVMTAFAEILEKKWTLANIPRVEAEHAPLNKLHRGQLTGHTRPKQKAGSTTNVTQVLFLDDSGFPFNSKDDATKGTKLIRETFSSLGLEMHCGNNQNPKSKTEILWIPAPSFYKQTPSDNAILPPTNASLPNSAHDPTNPAMDTTDDEDEYTEQVYTLSLAEQKSRHLTFYTMSQQQREQLYWDSPTTKRIHIDDESFIDFTAHFKYLGSFISFDLTDDKDIKNRITKANQAMGALRHFWRNPYADLKAKKLIFLAIPANLLLWGCETWALRQSHIDRLNAFWHRAIRNILGIRMTEVIDDHITNERIRKIFHDIPDAEALLTARSMTYLGKIARAPDLHPPKLLMTAWVRNPRPKSGVLYTNKKALVRGINTLLPEETAENVKIKCKKTGLSTTVTRCNPDGKLSNWLHIALNKPLWDWHIHRLANPGAPTPPKPPSTPRPNNQQRRRDSTNQRPQPDNNTRPNTEREQPRQNNNRSNQHRRRTPRDSNENATPPDPSRNHTQSNYNLENVGKNRTDSLLALGLHFQATDGEIKHRFRRLSLIYHPDKYIDTLGISKEEATSHFQLINNAYDFLKHQP